MSFSPSSLLSSANSRETLGSFLRTHFLGILYAINEILLKQSQDAAVDNNDSILPTNPRKISVFHQLDAIECQKAARALVELIKIIGNEVYSIHAQVIATLQLMTSDNRLQWMALQGWDTFIKNLEVNQLGPLLSTICVSLLRLYEIASAHIFSESSLSATPSRLICHSAKSLQDKILQLLGYLIVDHRRALGHYVNDLFFLPETPEFASLNHAVRDAMQLSDDTIHLKDGPHSVNVRSSNGGSMEIPTKMDHRRQCCLQLLHGIENENPLIVHHALTKLCSFLCDHQAWFHDFVLAEHVDPLISNLMRSLLSACQRFGNQSEAANILVGYSETSIVVPKKPISTETTIQLLVAECLGILGAIDPGRLNVHNNVQRSIATIVELKDRRVTIEFACTLIADHLVPLLRTAGDTKMQNKAAYAIQELLKYCAFPTDLPMHSTTVVTTSIHGQPVTSSRRLGASVFPHSSGLSSAMATALLTTIPFASSSSSSSSSMESSPFPYRHVGSIGDLWLSFPRHVHEAIQPLLLARYTMQFADTSRSTGTIFPTARSFQDWLTTLVTRLMTTMRSDHLRPVFFACRGIVRNNVAFSVFLLPFLLLNNLIMDDKQDKNKGDKSDKSKKQDNISKTMDEDTPIKSDIMTNNSMDGTIKNGHRGQDEKDRAKNMSASSSNTVMAKEDWIYDEVMIVLSGCCQENSLHETQCSNSNNNNNNEMTQLCIQTIFTLLDQLSAWKQQHKRLLITKRTNTNTNTNTTTTTNNNNNNTILSDQHAEQAIQRVEAFIERIPHMVLAGASYRCKAYARALMHIEQHIRSQKINEHRYDLQLSSKVAAASAAVVVEKNPTLMSTTNDASRTSTFVTSSSIPMILPLTSSFSSLAATTSQPLLEQMQRIYANLDEPDGMDGIARLLLQPSLDSQILEHEACGRWTSAQTCYELALQKHPHELRYHVGLMQCLKNLGHLETLLTHARGLDARLATTIPEDGNSNGSFFKNSYLSLKRTTSAAAVVVVYDDDDEEKSSAHQEMRNREPLTGTKTMTATNATIINTATSLSTMELRSKLHSDIYSLGVEAAWRLADWNTLRELVGSTTNDSSSFDNFSSLQEKTLFNSLTVEESKNTTFCGVSSKKTPSLLSSTFSCSTLSLSFEVLLGRILLAWHDKDHDAFISCMQLARTTLLTSLAAANMESYHHAYSMIVKLHMLVETECMYAASMTDDEAPKGLRHDRLRSLYRKPPSVSMATDKLSNGTCWWDSRLKITQSSFRVREGILNLRRILISLQHDNRNLPINDYNNGSMSALSSTLLPINNHSIMREATLRDNSSSLILESVSSLSSHNRHHQPFSILLQADIGQIYLQSAKAARHEGYFASAYHAILHAEAHGAATAYVERAKWCWDKGEHQKALMELQKTYDIQLHDPFLDRARDKTEPSSNSDSTISPPDFASPRFLHAKTVLLLGRWMEETGHSKSNDILSKYLEVISLQKRWTKGYYYLGRYQNRLFDNEFAQERPGKSMSVLSSVGASTSPITAAHLTYIVHIIRNYARSLLCETQFLYQILPKLLTLWLDFGAMVSNMQDSVPAR